MAEPELSFAGLLRQLRAEARLTQEELAEAASLSPQAVAALERGIHRTAHKDTAVLLAGALGLPEQVRLVFVAAARGKAPAADVLVARRGLEPGAFAPAATQALPRDIAAFTGRQPELALLMGTLAASGGVVGIHAIDGMAGIGKTIMGREDTCRGVRGCLPRAGLVRMSVVVTRHLWSRQRQGGGRDERRRVAHLPGLPPADHLGADKAASDGPY